MCDAYVDGWTWTWISPGMKLTTGCSSISLNSEANLCSAVLHGGICRVWERQGAEWRQRRDIEGLKPYTTACIDGAAGLVAIGSTDGRIHLVDSISGRVTKSVQRFGNAVGQLIAIEEAIYSASSEGSIACDALPDLAPRWKIKENVLSLNLSEHRIMCAGFDGILCLDSLTGEVLVRGPEESRVIDVARLSDDAILSIERLPQRQDFYGVKGGTLRLWRPSTDDFTPLCDRVTTLANYAPGEVIFGSASGQIGVTDGVTARWLSSWRPHYDRVNSISVASEGRFATASRDGRTGLWSGLDGAALGEPVGGKEWYGCVTAACISDGGVWIGFESGDLIRLNTRSGESTVHTTLQEKVGQLCPSHAGIMAIAGDGQVVEVDQRGGQVHRAQLKNPCRAAARTTQRQYVVSEQGELLALSLSDAKGPPLGTGINDVSCLAQSPSGKMVAIGCDKSAEIFFLAGESAAPLVDRIDVSRGDHRSNSVLCLNISDKGEFAALVGCEGVAHLVHGQIGSPEITQEVLFHFYSLPFDSVDVDWGRRLAIVSAWETAAAFELGERNPYQEAVKISDDDFLELALWKEKLALHKVLVTPDGDVVAIGNNGDVRMGRLVVPD